MGLASFLDIFKNDHINIDIIKKCRHIDNQSINHVFQLDRTGACFNITAKDYICPTGAMYSQEM